MKSFSKKLTVTLLAVLTALCAFFGILLTTPQTARADEATEETTQTTYEVSIEYDMPDTSNYVESDVVEYDNVAGKYLRIYPGNDIWIYPSLVSVDNMHGLTSDGIFKMISDGTWYDVKLPCNVGNGYVDVYLPIGTFTDGEHTFELIDTYYVGNYVELVKVLTAPADEAPDQPDEQPGEQPDGATNTEKEDASFLQDVLDFFKSLSVKEIVIYSTLLLLLITCIVLIFKKK